MNIRRFYPFGGEEKQLVRADIFYGRHRGVGECLMGGFGSGLISRFLNSAY